MSVYFGSINHIQQRIARIYEKERLKHILIVSSGINFIDLSGTQALVAESDRLKKVGGGIYFVGLKLSAYQFAVNSKFVSQIGPENFFDSKADAIEKIYARLDRDICSTCRVRIFRECGPAPDSLPAIDDDVPVRAEPQRM